MILNLFMFSCVVHPVVFLHRLCFHPSIMICNECICLQLLGWHAPFYFFILSMFPTLGLHQLFNIRFNIYKDKDEVSGMDIPPNTMESDSAIRDVPQWQRVSTATAVLMEREWPLHPFLLQLLLGAVAAAVN